MHNFKELRVWKFSREFVVDIYKATTVFPKHELYGITTQLHRAVVSIPINIAEGAGRNTSNDFCGFLDIAFGSALEVETLIYVCFDLEYVDESSQNKLLTKVTDIQKMLSGLIKKMRVTES